METTNEEHPLKIRSARACVSAGFRLYFGNFKRIFRATWIPALVSALVSAVYTQTAITAITQAMQAFGMAGLAYAQGLTQQYLAQSGMTLLNAVVSVVLMSYIFSMLTVHRAEGAIPRPARWWTLPDVHGLTRAIASASVWLLTNIMVSSITVGIMLFGAARQSGTLIAAGLLVMLIFGILLLPLVYPHMRYLTTRDTKLIGLLRTGYGQGLRQWGFIFAILITIVLIMMIVLSITMLPAIVLVMASIKSQAGVMIGDPVGMPSYMGWLSFVVFMLSGFIQAYIVLAIHFPLYYMAGSIEQQEIQRHEKKNTLH